MSESGMRWGESRTNYYHGKDSRTLNNSAIGGILRASAAILCVCLGMRAFGAQESNLRGYGKVTVEYSSNRVEFTSEDKDKADILFGKLLADMFWDARNLKMDKIKVKGKEITIRSYPPYGAIVAAKAGRRVMILGADSKKALLPMIAKEPFLLQKDVVFNPEREYPIYLDFYDLKAFKVYTHAMTSVHNEGLESHWKFVKKFGLGGISFQNLSLVHQSPAPGMFDWVPADYEVTKAEDERGMIVPAIQVGGEVPLWVYNDFPFDMMRRSPTALFGGWSKHTSSSGAHYASWCVPVEKKERAEGLWLLKDTMNRYGKSSATGGWNIYAGAPGAEMGFHDRTGEFWDYSVDGENGFRDYLAKTRGYSLQDLGKRWYGDASRFKSWNEVEVPDANSFFGKLDKTSFRIDKNWKFAKAGKGASLETPPDSSGKWIPMNMQPSQQQGYLPYGTAFYKTLFDAKKWLKANKGKRVYLVCCARIRSSEGIAVWLNGDYLGQHKSRKTTGPIALDVTKLLKGKQNVLTLRIPGYGKIFGPVFLTTTSPAYYPYLGKHENARYVDFKEWQKDALCLQHLAVIKEIRNLDPERSIILSPGSSLELADVVSDYAVKFGLGLQMTGRNGWYFPWWSGLGLVNGFYGTGEPGGTARGKNLDRLLGWTMFDGDSSMSLFWDIEDYIQEENKNAWFTRHKRHIELFGKALREKPSIIILRSARNQQLGSQAAYTWDIGRGELQSTHFDNAYVTERGMRKGLIDGYPVVIDSGTEIMSDELVTSIERYVEKGGIFIALHNTGKHSLLEPDTYPISRLTGFKPVSTRKKGKIRFVDDPPIFKKWAGREFEGDGSCLDWLKNESAKGVGLGLRKITRDAVPIAKWDDGSVAIGFRKLGKGYVVYLGSTFWRNGKDLMGVWRSGSQLERAFLERLFTDLGVRRNTDASSDDIWTREFITKNGLQEWLLAYNSGDSNLKADLEFKVSRKPVSVMDLVAEKPVPFQYENGRVKVANMKFFGQQVRVFAVKRASLLGGIPFWWAEKKTYWRKTPLEKSTLKSSEELFANRRIPFETWKFRTDEKGDVSASPQWMKAGFDDTSWKSVKSGAWNLRDAKLKEYHGIGLYRSVFHLPNEWKGHRIILGLYSYNSPIVYDKGEFYLNGKKVTTYKARGWNQTLMYDLSDKLKSGENVLAVKVTGGKKFSGICGVVWIQPQKRLSPQIDLSGDWTLVGGDYVSRKSIEVPGNAYGKYIERTIDIPAGWKGRNIYIHIKTPYQWLGSVVVNGQPVNYNSSFHPFGLISDINVTPYISAGKNNKLELWPYGTPAGQEYRKPEMRMTIEELSIGCDESGTLKQ